MRALLCTEWGPASKLVVGDAPDPEPGPTDAVVRVHAASVNFPDTLIIENKYQMRPAPPFSPGGECTGVVEAVGAEVTSVRPGDRVLAFTGYGCFAEKVRVDARALVPLDRDVDLVLASTLPMTFGTSLHALEDRAALRPGETLVVLGASGGVGLAAIEIGKALGARVIAAASNAERLALCKEHGADACIDYGAEDLGVCIKDLTRGKGADIVYDPVGGPLTERAVRSLAWRGRLLVIGFASGEIPKIPLNLPLLKGCSLVGVFWGELTRREPERLAVNLQTLFLWLKEGKIRPHVSGTYPLERGAEAIAALAERRVSGKLVITP